MEFKEEMLKAYFVCGSQDLVGQDFEVLLEEAIDGGITAFQYRDKAGSTLTSEQRLQLGKKLRKICRDANIPFFVDDDVELANQLQADGIHVGQKDMNIIDVVSKAAPEMIIGLSCQTIEQVKIANQVEQIDYLGSGPIVPTISKDDATAPIGLTGLQDLVNESRVPIVAIGGITDENVHQLKAAGASGAAFISLLTRSKDVSKTVNNVLDAFA
ncbi:thiamine phosphate synthase [Companilactobacillus furfuricola]|uniref:thiamine phosphate synthase n=1 Tax=Companilactobacillus furfuricola TaxID=1462575 RepID=UPI000F76DF7A|nr:thiamine phosphate synthase [Companilactobacillus furfuricola]